MRTKKSQTAENDFQAMERLAQSITPSRLRPLTPEQRRRWEAAKHARPKQANSAAAKSIPTLIAVDVKLLRRIDAYAKKTGVSRSQLFSDAIRQRINVAE